MLDAVGIHASPALLLASGNMEGVPSPMEFDHVISYVVLDGKELWLDTTLGVAPFGYLWPNVRGKLALVATRELGSELRQIPSALATPTLYRFALDGKLGDNRNLDAILSFETRGDGEVLLRRLVQASPAQLQSMMEAAAKKSSKTEDVTFSNLDASDPYDTSAPLRLSLRRTARCFTSAIGLWA
jgi:hypothetical protein